MSNYGREWRHRSESAGDCEAALGTAAAPTGNEYSAAQSAAPYTMMALACLGMAIAFYDSWSIYIGQVLWCPPPFDGCNEVAASPYARILDVPVGYYGVVYYLCVFVMSALLAREPWARSLRIAAVACTALGVLFSAYFMILQIVYIHAFCIYCLVSAITTILLTVTATWHSKSFCPRVGDAQWSRP